MAEAYKPTEEEIKKGEEMVPRELNTEFDKIALEKYGFQLLTYGFFDAIDRRNPDGSIIIDGHGVYQNKDGVYADSYYLQTLMQRDEDLKVGDKAKAEEMAYASNTYRDKIEGTRALHNTHLDEQKKRSEVVEAMAEIRYELQQLPEDDTEKAQKLDQLIEKLSSLRNFVNAGHGMANYYMDEKKDSTTYKKEFANLGIDLVEQRRKIAIPSQILYKIDHEPSW